MKWNRIIYLIKKLAQSYYIGHKLGKPVSWVPITRIYNYTILKTCSIIPDNVKSDTDTD